MKKIISICLILFIPFSSFAGTPKKSLSDGEIIGIYNQVNSFDIETALLAIVNGKSEKVKKLATDVSNDHRGVRLQAAILAREINAEVTLPVARQDAALYYFQDIDELSNKTGDAFDRAYLLYEIQFHKNALEAVQKILLPTAKSKKLKVHFETVLPHFKHHLNETIKVAKELGHYTD